MLRTRPPYPPEFRRETTRLVRVSDEDHPIPRIDTEFGVTAETLRNWVKQDETDEGEREGLATEEKEDARAGGRGGRTAAQGAEVRQGLSGESVSRRPRGVGSGQGGRTLEPPGQLVG